MFFLIIRILEALFYEYLVIPFIYSKLLCFGFIALFMCFREIFYSLSNLEYANSVLTLAIFLRNLQILWSTESSLFYG